MTEITARFADAEHTSVIAEIDGVQMNIPYQVTKTRLRGPAKSRKVPRLTEDGEPERDEKNKPVLDTVWDDGELTGEEVLSSGNRELQMVLDSGVEIAEYAPPPVTAEQVQEEADRRIEALIPPRARLRAMTEDVPLPANIKTEAKRIRKKADDLAKLAKIPDDFTDDKHWGK